MKSLLLRVLTAAALSCSIGSLHAPVAAAQAAAQTAPSQYVLRFGDALNMQVVGNEALAIKDQAIRPDGRISLPLVGELQAGGLTVAQFQERVTRAYTKFFVDPQVVVNVAQFRPLKISVMGWVKSPDTYNVAEPTRLVAALALAGGADPRRGDLSRVLVLRNNGDRQLIDVNVVLEGNSEQNVLLYDGDTVKVEEVTGPDWGLILPPLAQVAATVSALALAWANFRR